MQQQRTTYAISVAIPAYGRCSELEQLLQSIYAQTVLPAEITICEDMSPDREAIRQVIDSWSERFSAECCTMNYHENERNLGYDGNVRKIIHVSHSPWVMLMGNDDLLLPDCIEATAKYLTTHPNELMISRSFLRFEEDISRLLDISRLSPADRVYTRQNSSPGMIIRTCGFVGGLILNRNWADALATERYDGSLYYQIYLGAVAYCQRGIGYISHTIVGARAGNPPLFGSASAEKDVHIPGSYTPRGRARMWAAILKIADDVGTEFNVPLLPSIKEELEVRQSFHIFEMMSGATRQRLQELRQEFEQLGLFSHALPRLLYTINLVFGRWSRLFYRAVRVVRGWIAALHTSNRRAQEVEGN